MCCATPGQAVGLVKVRLFRPLPARALRAALAGVPEVVVLDRNYSPGHGGMLHQELRAALYGVPGAPRVHGYSPGSAASTSRRTRSSNSCAGRHERSRWPDSVWVR